jgi:hypothetical protein
MFRLHRLRFVFLAAGCALVAAGCGGGSTYVPVPNQYGALQTGSVARGGPVVLGGAEAFAEPSDFFGAAANDATATADSAPDAALESALASSDTNTTDVDSDAAISGTYDGTLTEKAGSVTIKGTVVISLARKAPDVSGKFVFTYKGHKSTVTYTGTGQQTAHGFAMSLLLVNSRGCSATGPATVAKKTISGSFKAPPCKGAIASSGTYKAVKKV